MVDLYFSVLVIAIVRRVRRLLALMSFNDSKCYTQVRWSGTLMSLQVARTIVFAISLDLLYLLASDLSTYKRWQRPTSRKTLLLASSCLSTHVSVNLDTSACKLSRDKCVRDMYYCWTLQEFGELGCNFHKQHQVIVSSRDMVYTGTGVFLPISLCNSAISSVWLWCYCQLVVRHLHPRFSAWMFLPVT